MSIYSPPIDQPAAPSLPARKNFGTLALVELMAPLQGHDVETNARLLSSAEWTHDLWRAEELRSSQLLTDEQWREVLGGLQKRNREHWVQYCEARLPE